MRTLILVCTLLVGCSAHDPNSDAQYLQSVKGGGGQFQYRGGENLSRFFNGTQGHGASNLVNSTGIRVGICVVEVPTVSLTRDHKPAAGNGSRSDLSRIETCCNGYIRNIHNFRICDPVCSNGCVNGRCTAPDTCTCYPEHVRNLAGFCVPTCPIGCQNGHCAGGECMCKEGFTLDRSSKFCVPRCRDSCGGGNCTAPNTCSCVPGYHATPEGSCRPGVAPPTPNACSDCVNGDCVNGKCQCRPGYLIYRGECFPLCNPGCSLDLWCVAPNTCSSSPRPTSRQPQNINHSNLNQSQSNTNHGQNATTTLVNYPYPPNSQNLNGQNTNPNYSHIYPALPQNQYPANPNQPNNGNGQVYYQNPYNPLENTTFNLQQGAQGYTHGQGQFTSQGQSNEGYYPSQGQIAGNRPSQNPYNPLENATFNSQQGTQGFSHGQSQYTSQGQYNEGQYSSHGQTSSHGFNQNTYNPLENVTFNSQQGTQGLTHGQNQHTSQGQGQYGQSQTGQVYYQNSYNPLENTTFNLQRGAQGTSQGQGQVSIGQQRGDIDSTLGQNNQHQSTGQISQNPYNPLENTTFNSQQGHIQGQNHQYQGQYGQGQYAYGQRPQGPTYIYGQTDLGQYGQDQSQSWPEQGSQCAQSCLNGNCVGPNRCECLPGYKLDQADLSGSRCLPNCPGGCHNGVCTAPNVCTCNTGYYRDFSVKGRSVCVLRERR